MEVESPVVAWRTLATAERREWAAAIAAGVLVDRTGEAITVNGPCPRCGHEFSVVLTDNELLGEPDPGFRSMVARSRAGGRIDWGGMLRFLVACHCDGDHRGRPSIIGHGCGASGWLIDEIDEP